MVGVEEDEGSYRDIWEKLRLQVDPHPVIVTIRDNRGHIRVLFIFLLSTITGRGVLLI